MQPKNVLELITDRLFARHNGTPINDGAWLCLAVEGGGMRGIVSAGMLLALYDLDIIGVFDDFVGISAGSLNLAYTLVGQGALGLSVYFEDMTDKDIVNLLRFRSKEHPIMNMRRLYDHTTKDKRLNLDKLKAEYDSSFHVSVTNVTKNVGELISLESAGHRFEEFLAAGAMLPFVAGEPWIINNNEYYDGSLHYIDPFQAAMETGATHAFVLGTQPQDRPIRPWGKIIEHKIKSLDEHYPGAGSHYLERLKNYVDTYSNLPFAETAANGVWLYRHSLAHTTGVGRLTMDNDKLIDGVKQGYASVVNIFYKQGRVGIAPTLM